MRRVLCALTIALSVHVSADAQGYSFNAVFPIVNTYSEGLPEFIKASVANNSEYMGKTVYVSNMLELYSGSQSKGTFYDGSYISFSYVSRTVEKVNSQWFHGSTSTQMAFHPGGQEGFNYRTWTAETTSWTPLYAFRLGDNGLDLVNLWDGNVVAHISDSQDIKSYAFLTVFAGSNFTDKDIIVVAGENLCKVFETIPNSNGVREVSVSDKESYFGINGQKYDQPQQGVNIVVDGDKTKKIVVK